MLKYCITLILLGISISSLFSQTTDTNFGQGGLFSLQSGSSGMHATAVATQTDGKIVLAGWQTQLTNHRYRDLALLNDWWVERRDELGQLDAGFGDQGKLTLDLGGKEEHLHKMLITRNGRILLAGRRDHELVFIRLLPDGSLDNSFGKEGMLAFSLTDVNTITASLYELREFQDGCIYFLGRGNGNFGPALSFFGKLSPQGELDLSFGDQAFLKTPATFAPHLYSFSFQKGKYLLCSGQSGQGKFVFRTDMDGKLDLSFGNQGIREYTTTAFPGFAEAQIDPGQRLLLASALNSFAVGKACTRLTAEGEEDRNFIGRFPILMSDFFAETRDMKLLPDSSVLLLYWIFGQKFDPSQQPRPPAFQQAAVLKLNEKGIPDIDFGFTGFVTYTFENEDFEALDMYVQADGKILITGTIGRSDLQAISGGDIGLIRLLADGSLDPSIAERGYIRINSNQAWSSGFCMTTDARGNIWTGGSLGINFSEAGAIRSQSLLLGLDGNGEELPGRASTNFLERGFEGIYELQWGPDSMLYALGEGLNSYFVNRFHPTGRLDLSFGTNGNGRIGSAHDSFSGNKPNFKILPDGKLLFPATLSNAPTVYMSLFELDQDGIPDFGGRIVLDFGQGESMASQLQLLPNGQKMLIGFWRRNSRDVWQLASCRLRGDNQLDRAYGKNGWKKQGIQLDNFTMETAILADGKLLVSGTQADRFAIFRFLPDGQLDPDFGFEGKVSTDFPGHEASMYDMQLLPDGRILLAGGVVDEDGAAVSQDIGLACYLPDGRLDRGFGEEGRFVLDIDGGPDVAYDILLDAKNRILLTGSSRDELMVMRLLPKLEISFDDPVLPLVYPNPISKTATIRFELFQPEWLKVELRDLQGRKLHVFSTGTRPAGWHEESLEIPGNILPGIYVIGFQGERSQAFVKVIIKD